MKKLSKYIKYMVFVAVLMLMTTGNVFASCAGESKACKVCEYNFDYIGENITVKYKAVDDGNGDITLESELKNGKGFEISKNDIFGSAFKPTSGNLLYCPTLYYSFIMPQGNNNGTNITEGVKKIKVSTSKKDNYVAFNKGNQSGNNVPIAEKTKDSVMCGFTIDIKDATGKVLVNGEKLNFNITDGSLPSKDTTGQFSLTFKDGISFSDFSQNGQCNYNAYVLCQATKNTSGIPNGAATDYAPLCTFSKSQIIFSEQTEIKKPDNYDNGNTNENNTGDVGDSGGITFGDGDADCKYILSQLLDEAQKIFDWLKIIAPILVIAFGSLDFVKATVAMDDKGMKTAMNKFPKRLIAAAALFFLPYLINLVLSLPGLEIENAVCGIGKVVFKLW